ncbi:unnamed protein product [Allacma fusca]|uniref:DDHD domain-containing protein n=1 Tax=Allacma fusca TaxID=39272 RepID=A0A8J2NX99_9HEXA|nr:unnamed protein product [Allacma fusca]
MLPNISKFASSITNSSKNIQQQIQHSHQSHHHTSNPVHHQPHQHHHHHSGYYYYDDQSEIQGRGQGSGSPNSRLVGASLGHSSHSHYHRRPRSSYNNRMAYYPSELAMLEPALIVDEDLEDLVRVRMDSQGDSEINLYSQYTTEQNLVDPEYNRVESFEDYMSHEPAKRAIPMPMPGYVDQPLTEPDYLDTPYQLKTLGPSLSSYSDREYDTCLHPPEGVNPHPPNSSSTEEIEVKQSDSSESQAYYGTENVVRELRMEYVRWFYKNDGDRKWTPFTGYDSMRIEARHRELCLRDEEQETSQEDANSVPVGLDMENSFDTAERRYLVNSSGYLYQAPCTLSSNIPGDGVLGMEGQQQQSSSSSVTTRTKRAYKSFTRKWKEWSASAGSGQGSASPKHSSSEAGTAGTNAANCQRARAQWPPVPPPSNPDNIIIVRGGLYEVDLEHNLCYATYWPDLCSITRGIWFYDGVWQPIDWTQADKLEIEHLEKFGGASLITSTMESLPDSPTKKNKQVVHRVSFSDFHVDWSSATEIHLYSKAVPHKLMRSVGQRFGFQTGKFNPVKCHQTFTYSHHVSSA